MIKLVRYLILSLGVLAGAANADSSRLYYGLGLSDGNVEVGNTSRNMGTLTGNVGLRFSKHLGAELGYGFASSETGSLVTDPMLSYQALMFRVGWTFERFGVYFLAGHAAIQVDSSLNFTDSGIATGFGINLLGNKTTSVNIHMLNLDQGAFTSATLGFQHYFGGFR